MQYPRQEDTLKPEELLWDALFRCLRGGGSPRMDRSNLWEVMGCGILRPFLAKLRVEEIEKSAPIVQVVFVAAFSKLNPDISPGPEESINFLRGDVRLPRARRIGPEVVEGLGCE